MLKVKRQQSCNYNNIQDHDKPSTVPSTYAGVVFNNAGVVFNNAGVVFN